MSRQGQPTTTRGDFSRLGYLRLPAAIAQDAVTAMCERVWEVLAERHGVMRDAAETWTVPRPSGLKALQRSDASAFVGAPAVLAKLDALLGPGGWRGAWPGGRVLATFHSASSWDVPHKAWHIDFNAPAPGSVLPGVNVFAFLAPVRPRGGGPLAVAGSHRLVADLAAGAAAGDAGRSREIRKKLARRVPWLAELWSAGGDDRAARFMESGPAIGGAELRVVELTGEPGDVVIMHPWLFHTASPNARREPRLMLVNFVSALVPRRE